MHFRKYILTLFVVIALAVLGFVYYAEEAKSPVGDQPAAGEEQVIRYKGVEGKTALELLEMQYRVEGKDFPGVGKFVISINGIAPDQNHFWAFYVNGKQAEVGASNYITKNGDLIEWRLEKIKSFTQ